MARYTHSYKQGRALPQIIFGDSILTVDSRVSNIRKLEKIKEEARTSKTTGEVDFIYSLFSCIFGEKGVQRIKEADLTMQETTELVQIMYCAIEGRDYTPEEETPKN